MGLLGGEVVEARPKVGGAPGLEVVGCRSRMRGERER